MQMLNRTNKKNKKKLKPWPIRNEWHKREMWVKTRNDKSKDDTEH